MRRALVLVVLFAAACGGRLPPVPPPGPGPARAPAASTDWWNGAVVYEVFVRSFRDSDGDGVGDLAGIVEKLDYLNDGNPASTADLGVDAIWLMPVYPSPSYHGYDVTDYRDVKTEYGGMTALDALVTAAHVRGMKVVLDFVPNHTSIEHRWFVDSATAPGATYRDWYVWSASFQDWQQPWGGGQTWFYDNHAWYYAVFWSGMPDLNWKNDAVAAEIDAAAAFWIGVHGIDGLRLDAVRYLEEDGRDLQADRPGTHARLKELAAAVRGAKADALLVGEAWADTATIATYFGSTAVLPQGDELPLAFDFPLADAVLSSVSSGDAWAVVNAMDAVATAYPPGTGDAPFLSNHDQDRVASRLGGDLSKERLAAAILFTLQGTPFVYYGEEIGMPDACTGDDRCRRAPFAWDGTAKGGFTTGTPWFQLAPGTSTANVAAETADAGSLLSRYRALIRARKSSPALARGGTARLGTPTASVLAWLRQDPTQTALVVHNLAAGGTTVALSAPGAAADPIFVDAGASIAPGTAAGTWTVTLPARGSAVWALR